MGVWPLQVKKLDS